MRTVTPVDSLSRQEDAIVNVTRKTGNEREMNEHEHDRRATETTHARRKIAGAIADTREHVLMKGGQPMD